MDGGAILSLVVMCLLSLVALAGMAWSVWTLSLRVRESNDLLAKLAMTRPWYVIERGDDGSLLSIQQLKASESEWADKFARLEEQLREERARHQIDLMKLGGHPEVPDPVMDPTDFNRDPDLVTIGDRDPG